MAKIELYIPKLLKYEGGFVEDPTDKGGATNKGVTLATWKKVGYDKDGDKDIDRDDVKLISIEDATMVCKKNFWDRWRADEIINQSVAETLVEWVWGSGAWGIKLPQRLLGLKEDGSVGPITLAAVNNHNQAQLHEKIRLAKISFIDGIVNNSVTDLYNSLKSFKAGTFDQSKSSYHINVIKGLASKYTANNFTVEEKDLLTYTQKRFMNGWKRRINEFIFSEVPVAL